MTHTATDANAISRHVLAILLDNETGALMRVVNLFSSRGYNIDSLTVSEVNQGGGLSRITVATYAPDKVIRHIIHLLERLVPVHRVDNLSECDHVECGLLLFKVCVIGAARQEMLSVAQEMGVTMLRETSECVILQAAESQEGIDKILLAMRKYNPVEVARTGVTALAVDDILRSRSA